MRVLLLATWFVAGCSQMVTSAMNQAVANAFDSGDGTLRLKCKAAGAEDLEPRPLDAGGGVVGLVLAPVVDERRRGDTLAWVQEREVFGEGDGDAFMEVDDETAQVLRPGLRHAVRRDLPVLLGRRGITPIDPADAPDGAPVLQATLVRSDVVFRSQGRRKSRQGLRGVVVLDLQVGPAGLPPTWSRSFVGDTIVRAGPSAGDSHYERAFGVAWCQVLRDAAAAMDSAEFRDAVLGQ